jgi:hypothetical protein
MTRMPKSTLPLLAIIFISLVFALPALARGANARALRIAPFQSSPRIGQFRHFRFDLANMQLNRHSKNNRYLMLDQGF